MMMVVAHERKWEGSCGGSVGGGRGKERILRGEKDGSSHHIVHIKTAQQNPPNAA
jgi:hypothetical protein